MESAYRRWIHAGKNDIESDTVREELRRDLHTALGTAKWQVVFLNFNLCYPPLLSFSRVLVSVCLN